MSTPAIHLLISHSTSVVLVADIQQCLQRISGTTPLLIKIAEDDHHISSEAGGCFISLLPDTTSYPAAIQQPILEIDPHGLLLSLKLGKLPRQDHNRPTMTWQMLQVRNGERTVAAAGRYRVLQYAPDRTAVSCYEHVLQMLEEMLTDISGPSEFTRPALPDTAPVLSGIETKLQHAIRTLFYAYKWNIGIIDRPIHEVAFSTGNLQVKWLDEAPGLDFKADPFGFIHNGNEHLLYEYYDARRRKGYLKHRDQTGDHFFLEAAEHLSYPYLLQYRDQRYLIPESASAGSTAVYQLNTLLPRDRNIFLAADAVDPTVFQYEGKWWLFCTHKKQQAADLKLFIYYSDDPLGPWQPHRLNPVKTDICTARPGGTPFLHSGKLYRPAQDSSTGYGAALYIMEIITLTPHAFDERPANRLQPLQLNGPYREGLHTLSALGNKTLIDAKRKVFTLQPFLQRFVK